MAERYSLSIISKYIEKMINTVCVFINNQTRWSARREITGMCQYD